MSEKKFSNLEQAIYTAGLKGPVSEEVFTTIFLGLGHREMSYASLITTISRLNKVIAPEQFIKTGSSSRKGGIGTYTLVLPDANN